MAKDELKKNRKKSRFILEVKYPPLVQAFDRRGKILEIIHADFKQKMEHWRTQNVAVHMSNDFDNPSKLISIDHLRSLFIYEDVYALQEFNDDAVRFLKKLYEVFTDNIRNISRIGIRFISILSDPAYKDFDQVFKKIMDTFFNTKIPISLKLNDCKASFKHDTGNISIGPVRENESWVKEIYSLPDKNVPPFGFGLDIDSFALDIPCNTDKELISAFQTVLQLTLATEKEIADSLKIGASS